MISYIMCDKLVFDLSQEIEGSPNVFVRKDWINILDNQNQNYNNNQSVVDTSQLSNSNKYMSYREAYFLIPFNITLMTLATPTMAGPAVQYFDPTTPAKSCDYAIGLKNWFGQIIHSFTLDYNGTTIVQQTPYVNMWNSFKLMTSLSLGDIKTQGATIGFYPDDSLSWSYYDSGVLTSPHGTGVCNNTNFDSATIVGGALNNFKSNGGNNGLTSRQQLINFDLNGQCGQYWTGVAAAALGYGGLISGGTGAAPAGAANNMNLLWKSYIVNKRAQTAVQQGYIQYSITACVYLKHIHSFFNMCPLLKGVFMKMTMNLNNTSTDFITVTGTTIAPATVANAMSCVSVSNPLGGVNPVMIASTSVPLTVGTGSLNGGSGLCPLSSLAPVAAGTETITYRVNLSVGGRCLDATFSQILGTQITSSQAQSVYLYIPAYIFNPTFESAYLSSPVKQIKYTDIYQYQVLGVGGGSMINNLLTNGIANVKSVLVLPFYSSGTGNVVGGNSNSGFIAGTPVWQSPFDPAGTGPTSPLSWITNFNIQVSGQNAIYNLEKYNFEQFNNQLYGQNAVNGGLTDGITSGLISRQDFDMEYCYYYVNIERMLPVEQSVPKSIQLIGQNMSSKAIDYICFVEYGCEIAIDALTGARV